MNILMITNTYLPHVGGVARSVAFFARAYEDMGHDVLVIAPEFEDQPEDEHNVVRVPAIQNFSGGDFSVVPPITLIPWKRIEGFEPDIVHSHHPFLMGTWGLRIATQQQIPLVFTHHTMYEQYTHYVPGDSPQLKEFVRNLVVGYCNLCNHVIAPSQSIADILEARGVETEMTPIPTGVHIDEFSEGDGARARKKHGIPEDVFVVGHLGRLASEKNLAFQTGAVIEFLHNNEDAHYMIAGKGPSRDTLEETCDEAGVGDRTHMLGVIEGQDLVDAYYAMDVFAFASKTETQGMVLVEAFATGTPVVALDAPGAREVVRNKENGRLISDEDAGLFSSALQWVHDLDEDTRAQVRDKALETARDFSMERCAERCIDLYNSVADEKPEQEALEDTLWHRAIAQIKTEWDLLKNTTSSAVTAWEGKDDD